MIVNFRAREISRGAHKLARTSTLIIIIKKKICTPTCLVITSNSVFSKM